MLPLAQPNSASHVTRVLQDRRVEITGPTDRKMVINALNRCGAGGGGVSNRLPWSPEGRLHERCVNTKRSTTGLL